MTVKRHEWAQFIYLSLSHSFWVELMELKFSLFIEFNFGFYLFWILRKCHLRMLYCFRQKFLDISECITVSLSFITKDIPLKISHNAKYHFLQWYNNMIYQISYQQIYQLEKVFRLVHELLDVNWGKKFKFHSQKWVSRKFFYGIWPQIRISWALTWILSEQNIKRGKKLLIYSSFPLILACIVTLTVTHVKTTM
jgi:hypothetical protein